VNPELFFCRLSDPASGACHPRRLTQDPAWDEQAIFTPDVDRIVFMSSRNLPGAHNDWATLATLLGLPAEYDYELILFVFSDGFLQPRLQQATDLYELTLRWNASRTRFKPGPVRRLTHSGEDGWVIPSSPGTRADGGSCGRRTSSATGAAWIRAASCDRSGPASSPA